MLKHLIGISAALSFLVIANVAEATPRTPFTRVHQVARFAPDNAVRQVAHKVNVSAVREVRASRPLITKPGSERINYADAPTRMPGDVTRTKTRSVHSPEQLRLMTAAEANDPIAQERQRQRNIRTAQMLRAKTIRAKFKGM
jgi:hypothetical protein